MYKLKKGITTGITEDELNRYVEEIIIEAEKGTLFNNGKLVYEKKSIEEIHKEAINRLKKLNGFIGRISDEKSLILENDVIIPTYYLRPTNSTIPPSAIQAHGCITLNIEERAFNKLYKKDLTLSDLPHGDIDLDIYETSKNVGAFYVNLMLDRVISVAIEKGYWLRQCQDIDKYIFNRDIAKVVDSPFTKDAITKAYYHVIGKLFKMLSENNGNLTLSNKKEDLLAYAHYLNFVLPNELEFLNKFTTDAYSLDTVPKVEVIIKDNESTFNTTKCTFSDPYDEWSDEYSRKEGKIDDAPTKLMERRIGTLPRINN